MRRTPHASEALRVFVKDSRFGFTGSEAGEDRNSRVRPVANFRRWIIGKRRLGRQLQRNSERVAWPLRGGRLLEKPPKSVCESGIADPISWYQLADLRAVRPGAHPKWGGRCKQPSRPLFPKCKTRRTRSDGSHYCQHLFREFIPAKRKRQA